MQKAEKEVWKQREQMTDPNFEPDKKRKAKKVKAVRSLKYAESNKEMQERPSSSTDVRTNREAGQRMTINEVIKSDCKSAKTYQQRVK